MLIGEVDIAMRDAVDDEVGAADGDDSPEITTEEAFSKRCIVEDKAYAHSQMVRNIVIYIFIMWKCCLLWI